MIEPKTNIDSGRKIFSDASLMKMIIPLFFEQLLTMMVGIADTFMISYAGDAAVSGVSLVNMFVTVFIYLFTALASGGAVVVSQYTGSGSRENADRSAGQLLAAATVISVVLMGATLIWNPQLLQFLFRRIEPDVMDACVIYLRIMALSFPALAVYNAGAALCRSTGRTDMTMKISIASNIINVAGNAIGIFLLQAGVAGVAYPTLIARTFSAVVITVVCFDQAQAVSYQWRNILTWQPAMVRRILNIAVPNGVENGLFQLVKVALSSITALFGTAQIAANGIAQSFWSLAAMTGVTMGPVFITVIGQCMGSGDTEAAEYYFKKLYRMTLAGSIVWNVLIFAVTPAVMLAYPLSDEIIHLVIVLVLIHNLFNAAAFPASGALPNGLRAAGDVRYTMYVAVASTIIIRFVLSVVLGIWMDLGVIGVAAAMCCDWVVRAVLFLHRFHTGQWKNFQVIEETD
ncbi:MAG: MATE family efflux transporter [Oscillospiraceae bacterium]|nr:MATE family efflux transporter [Oscillospiraceae bacterium]